MAKDIDLENSIFNNNEIEDKSENELENNNNNNNELNEEDDEEFDIDEIINNTSFD